MSSTFGLLDMIDVFLLLPKQLERKLQSIQLFRFDLFSPVFLSTCEVVWKKLSSQTDLSLKSGFSGDFDSITWPY